MFPCDSCDMSIISVSVRVIFHRMRRKTITRMRNFTVQRHNHTQKCKKEPQEFFLQKFKKFHGKCLWWSAYIIMSKTINQTPKYSDLSSVTKYKMNILKTFAANFRNFQPLLITHLHYAFCLSSYQTNQVLTSLIEFDRKHI